MLCYTNKQTNALLVHQFSKCLSFASTSNLKHLRRFLHFPYPKQWMLLPRKINLFQLHLLLLSNPRRSPLRLFPSNFSFCNEAYFFLLREPAKGISIPETKPDALKKNNRKSLVPSVSNPEVKVAPRSPQSARRGSLANIPARAGITFFHSYSILQWIL